MNRLLYLLPLWLVLPSIVSAQGNPDKYRVYIGTYTNNKLSKGIYQCELDLKDGKLSMPTLAAATNSPSFVAIHPNQKFLYAVAEGEKGKINAFAIAKTGELTFLNSQRSGGADPCHLVVDPNGKVVLAANYSSGSCCSIPITADGKLAEPASVIQHKGKSINKGNQEGPHAHSINMDKANKFAFCADLGIDKILVYRFDSDTKELKRNDHQEAFSVPAGTGPRHFAFHPDGKTAYINGEINMTIIACDYDAEKGVLTQKQILSTIPKDETRKNGSTAEVVVHPSGNFVYVSNRDPYNSIAIFSIDPKTRELKAVGHESRGIKTPRNFAIEPTGQYMLVANQSGNSVISFRINQKTGELTPTGSSIEVGAPVCVRFMPVN
jgi:6-phosphogluconolactonase